MARTIACYILTGVILEAKNFGPNPRKYRIFWRKPGAKMFVCCAGGMQHVPKCYKKVSMCLKYHFLQYWTHRQPSGRTTDPRQQLTKLRIPAKTKISYIRQTSIILPFFTSLKLPNAIVDNTVTSSLGMILASLCFLLDPFCFSI